MQEYNASIALYSCKPWTIHKPRSVQGCHLVDFSIFVFLFSDLFPRRPQRDCDCASRAHTDTNRNYKLVCIVCTFRRPARTRRARRLRIRGDSYIIVVVSLSGRSGPINLRLWRQNRGFGSRVQKSRRSILVIDRCQPNAGVCTKQSSHTGERPALFNGCSNHQAVSIDKHSLCLSRAEHLRKSRVHSI